MPGKIGDNLALQNSPSLLPELHKINDTKDPAVKAVNDVATMTKWGRLLENAELGLKYCKKAFKYPQKFIKKLRIAESTGMFTWELFDWMKSANALEIYILFAGSVFLTYGKLKSNGPDATLTSRIGNFGSQLLTESCKITESYGLLTALRGIYQDPKSHIYPMIFAISMLSVSRFFPKSS